jgi:hypothetical protein
MSTHRADDANIGAVWSYDPNQKNSNKARNLLCGLDHSSGYFYYTPYASPSGCKKLEKLPLLSGVIVLHCGAATPLACSLFDKKPLNSMPHAGASLHCAMRVYERQFRIFNLFGRYQ